MERPAPNTNWVHVMENLDHEGFTIPDEPAFCLLMSVYARACKEPFPLHAVCGSLWTNIDGQISLLRHAVLAPADMFTFSHCSNQLAFPDLASISPGNHAWYCLDLLEVLCQLAEVGDDVSVPLMLEYPLEHCPELLLVGLAHVNTERNLLQQNVMSRVFSSVLKDTAKSNVVKHLWDINPSLTLRGFVHAHSDPQSLLRIVDLCVDLKILSDVIDSAPFAFSIKFAAAASRKYHSHVKKWLSEKSAVYKGRFLEECVKFVKEIVSSTPIEQPQAKLMNMYWGSLPLFVEVCQSCLEELVSTQILDENSTVPSDTICKKLEEQVREMTGKYIFQRNCLDVVGNHINTLLKECRSSNDLITGEEQKVSHLKKHIWTYPYPHQTHPDHFETEFGPVIKELKDLIKSNDSTLKYLLKGISRFCIGDDSFRQVDDIFVRNKEASKRAGAIICEYHDYLCRFNVEISWLDGAGKQIEQIHQLLSGYSPVSAELRSHIRELKTRVRVLPKECPQNLYSRCEALDELGKLWVDIDILSKKLISLTEAAKDLCLRSKNQRILLIEKCQYATRFFNSDDRLKEEGSKVCEELYGLEFEVEQAAFCFSQKVPEYTQDCHTNMKYEQIILDNAKSWRTRLLLGRYILGEMRIQGRDMCSFVSTVVMTESLNKRETARRHVHSGPRLRPKEFDIKLSEHHLLDTMREYCVKNKRSGKEKLDVCLERMVESGVVSESAYSRPDAAATESTRYHISGFKKMKVGKNHAEAFHKLDDGKVLVGTFGITKGYYSLGPDDLYDVPKEALLETSPAGNKLTHAVVLVGYGVSPEGVAYYAYQNWYGPDWGKDGFGKVSCRSIRQLYSATL
ncbi:uncharacterized protein LOC124663986 [Lolium rigidum]|uniref:uncharacterized protein LOC124663986 n=1 Tax=Lolium rigidum TaxID=89674 RepID=UPI001F5CC29C|nr:uncharacterized protein LOC124663986 [Lolium rigidum]